MSECPAPIVFPATLWSAMGLERKVLHIHRSHFFPDCDYEEPSTSYKQEQSREIGKGGARGYRTRPNQTNQSSRSSSMSASRKVRIMEPDRQFSGASGTEFETPHPVEWDPFFKGVSDITASIPQLSQELPFSMPHALAKGKRSSRARAGPRFSSLLAAIDGGVRASTEPSPEPETREEDALPPGDSLVEALPETCTGAAVEGSLAVELPEKGMKWQKEEGLVLEEKGSGNAGNVSTSHSASSSQGGFALELSSPERISTQRAWSDCSDDLN